MKTIAKSGLKVVFILGSTGVSIGQNCLPAPGRGSYSIVGGNHIYYTLDATGIPRGADGTDPASAITTAIQGWNTALSGPNATDFEPAAAGQAPDVTIRADTGPSANMGTTQVANGGLIDSQNPAKVVIYPNAQFSNGAAAFDPNGPNYKNALIAVVLHEFAHVQGACDYDGKSGCAFVPDPWPGPSVLNFFHGTNNGQTTPALLAPTTCDVQNVNTYSHYTVGGGGAPGGNRHIYDPPPDGGGSYPGNGNSDSPCGGGSYFDSDTNTVYGWC